MYIHTQTGGKKGVEISGAADMGGLDFFNTQLEQCKGKVNLLEMAMHAMNKDIDAAEEESKGGDDAAVKLVAMSLDVQVTLLHQVRLPARRTIRLPVSTSLL